MQERPPKYQLVAETIGRQIQDGTFAEGSLLPTEAKLAALFKVSRHTVRHGLRELRGRGLVESRQGRGSKVLAVPAESGRAPVHHMLGFPADPFAWAFHVRGTETVELDAASSSDVGRPAGTRFIRLTGSFRKTATARDAPAQIFLDEIYAGIVSRFGEPGFRLPDMLEEIYGLSAKRIDQRMQAEPAGSADPVACHLVLTRRYISREGLVYLAVRAHCPPDAFSIASTFLAPVV